MTPDAERIEFLRMIWEWMRRTKPDPQYDTLLDHFLWEHHGIRTSGKFERLTE